MLGLLRRMLIELGRGLVKTAAGGGYPLIASTGRTRAARTAGRKPPISPMKAESAIEDTMICGVGSKPNTISAKVPAFSIVIFTAFIASAAALPMAPPATAKKIDSNKKAYWSERDSGKLWVRQK